MLKQWNNAESVCLAGLFHSIYGTWHFHHKTFPIEDRHIIRELIGYEAEFLAYIFCVTKRPKELLDLIGKPEIVVQDMYLDRPVKLSKSELDNLIEIEAANLLEQDGNIKWALDQIVTASISRGAYSKIKEYLAHETQYI